MCVGVVCVGVDVGVWGCVDECGEYHCKHTTRITTCTTRTRYETNIVTLYNTIRKSRKHTQ